MKVAVCIKQVPDTETKIKLNAEGHSQNAIDFRNIKWIINPYDEYGIEEAIKIQSQNSENTTTAICFGPKARTSDALKTALAMGINQAICIDSADKDYHGLIENLTVAKILFKCIQKTGPFDLIFVGRSAIDDNQSSVGPMLAGLLKIPHVSVVSQLEYQKESVIAYRDIESGAKEVVEVQLPVLIGVNKGLNTPRYATLPGIMKAKRKPLTEITLEDIGVDINENQYTDFKLPPESPPVQMIEGEPAQQAQKLVELLRHKEKIL